MKRLTCKICRRLGISVCGREKCALKKKPYPPGQKPKRRGKQLSEYGVGLREKQKLKRLYNLREAQFKKYVKEILEKRGKSKEDVSSRLYRVLEYRLDNIVFRLGFAKTRQQARQIVSHGHFLVNGKRITIPSYQVKKGDTIRLKASSLKKNFFQNIKQSLAKQKIPSWLTLDLDQMEAKVVGEPSFEEAVLPVDIPVIFEYYSR